MQLRSTQIQTQSPDNISSCIAIVFPLNEKTILVTGFEFVFAVTALYFSETFNFQEAFKESTHDDKLF